MTKQNEQTKVKASPVLLHLSKSGMDVEALTQIAGIAKVRLVKFLRHSETPDIFECYMLDDAFKYTTGTFLEEYTVWDHGTYQTA